MIFRQSFVIYLDRIEGAFKQWELYYKMMMIYIGVTLPFQIAFKYKAQQKTITGRSLYIISTVHRMLAVVDGV